MLLNLMCSSVQCSLLYRASKNVCIAYCLRVRRLLKHQTDVVYAHCTGTCNHIGEEPAILLQQAGPAESGH